MTLDQVIAGITPADTAAMERAKARWDSIAKPLGSLGALEEAGIRIAGMTGSADVGRTFDLRDGIDTSGGGT